MTFFEAPELSEDQEMPEPDWADDDIPDSDDTEPDEDVDEQYSDTIRIFGGPTDE